MSLREEDLPEPETADDADFDLDAYLDDLMDLVGYDEDIYGASFYHA